MRILIAGGGGYIGSSLTPKLIERGYDVDVVDLFWFGNFLPPDVRLVHRNLFDLTAQDMQGYDQVIFLAGLSNDPMAEFSPAQNFIFNAAAPAYLCYVAKLAGVRRYIYASSCSVYGYTENELYDEDRPTVSASAYGISKLQGERAVMQLADSNFSVIALRKGTVCGYSPRMRFDLIVNTMFKCALKDGIIRVNNPSIWRPILSIEDAISAYIRSVEAPPSLSGIFNIASGNHTVGEVADLVVLALDRELGLRPALEIQHISDVRNYKVTTQRAETVLSFHAHHSVSSIVRHLIENREKCGDWDNPLYYNIETFRRLEDRDNARSAIA